MSSDSSAPAPSPSSAPSTQNTQNTQYDTIGTKYNETHKIEAVEAESLSVIAGLGDLKDARCLDLACGTGRYTHLLHTLGASSVHGFDISAAMIAGAQATYPSSEYPTLHFAVADCSKPLDPAPEHKFDVVFAGWFLNYAGTEAELTNMFSVIRENLAERGRFVGITTNVHDMSMQEPKEDFYGLAVNVLDKVYKEPGGDKVLGIKCRVTFLGAGVSIEVFQFTEDVYVRCADRAGLRLSWGELVVPEDERKASGFWDRWIERPTFSLIQAERIKV